MKMLKCFPAFLLSLLFIIPALSQEEKPQRIVIFNLQNNSTEEKRDYLSKIIPVNISIGLSERGGYTVERVEDVVCIQEGESFEDYSSRIKDFAAIYDCDYIITGGYNYSNEKVAVTALLYVVRFNKIIELKGDRENPGAYLGEFIDELLNIISEQGEKYRKRKLPPPYFSVMSGKYKFYQKLEIMVPAESDIYYTTDGSSPVPKRSKIFRKPLVVEESSVIKALAWKEGYYMSDAAAVDMKIKYPLNDFTFGFNLGVMDFNAAWDRVLDKSDSRMISLYGYFELANFDAIKNVFFLNNLGIIFQADSAYAKVRESGFFQNVSTAPDLKYNYWGFVSGLIYKLRITDYASFDLTSGFGKARSQIALSGDHNGFMSHFKPPKDFERSNDSYLTLGASVNLIFDPVVFSAGTSYKQIFYKEEPLKARVYQLGAAYRF